MIIVSRVKETNTRKKTIINDIVGLIKHHNINIFIKNKNDEYIKVNIEQLRGDEIGDFIIDFME